jgi:hypothetical protein
MIIAVVVMGCTACVSPPLTTRESAESESLRREELAQQGLSLVGMNNPSSVDGIRRDDCSGFVLGVYRSLGYTVELDYYNTRYVADNLYRNLRSRGRVYYGMRPKKADLAFFRNTVANSGNRVTHVGMVTEVERDDTIVIVHYSSTGVSLMRMNLQEPHLHRDEAGRVLNDFLRKKPDGVRDARLLSGELFFMYGDLFGFAGEGAPPSYQ